MATATYTKLASGSWGIRVDADLSSVPMPLKIMVNKKDGTREEQVIEKILWVGEDKIKKGKIISLCAFTPKPRENAPPKPRLFAKKRGCRCDGRPGGYCCGRRDCQCYDCQ